MHSSFCVAARAEALARFGLPEIFKQPVHQRRLHKRPAGIRMSMDGCGVVALAQI
jgi:hypothetical protein